MRTLRSLRVLVVRLSAIGDVLHALPAVAALRARRPDAVIDWLVEDRAASVLERHPALDRVVTYPRRRWQRALRAPWRWPRLLLEASGFVRRLVARRYDATLDFQGNLKSGILAWVSGAPVRLGFPSSETREGNAFFTNRRVALPAGRSHRVLRNAALVAALLGEDAVPAASGLVAPRDGGLAVEAALLAAGLPPRGYVVLHPGTSGFGAFKRWPPERFARLADRIAERFGLPVALTFGPDEQSLADEVRSLARSRPFLPATPDLLSLAEVVRRARAFVAADTGPLHVAAAVGTPLVGLFGPKDEGVYGPFGVPAGGGAARALETVSRDDVPCRPCTLRWCPDAVCMSGIEVDTVFERLEALFAADRAPA